MNLKDIRAEYNKSYDKGTLNHGIRAWFYLTRGLQMINEFKYLVAGILAFYYTLELHSIPLLVTIFMVSIPILIGVGFFQTHKMAKALEWTGMMFSSYFARHNVDLQEQQVLFTGEQKELLHQILIELRKLNGERGVVIPAAALKLEDAPELLNDEKV